MPNLEQATDARLKQILGVYDSGVTELTGKARREYGNEGAFVGRFGGFKPSFRELQKIPDSPKSIAAAIRRGRGKVFNRVYRVVSDAMASEGYRPARKRSAGRRVVEPHSGQSYCAHCKDFHTRGQHRFHGPGSYHATHLFSFNKPPMTLAQAKQTFGEMMKRSQGGRVLSAVDRALLRQASTVIRASKRGRLNPRKKKQYSVGVKMVDGDYRVITSPGSRKGARTYSGVLGGGARVFRGGKAGMTIRPKTNRRKAKRNCVTGNNPRAGLVRMGKLVELRYERDHGSHKGFYKHKFSTLPDLYFDPRTNTIIAKGGK